jgi:hypothetical protein
MIAEPEIRYILESRSDKGWCQFTKAFDTPEEVKAFYDNVLIDVTKKFYKFRITKVTKEEFEYIE